MALIGFGDLQPSNKLNLLLYLPLFIIGQGLLTAIFFFYYMTVSYLLVFNVSKVKLEISGLGTKLFAGMPRELLQKFLELH